MEKVVLKATKRTQTGKQVSKLRRAGQLPAVIYGNHMDATLISLDAHSAGLTLPKLSSSSIVTIDLEGKSIPTLVREKQKNYIKNEFIHIDFQAVSLNEKIHASVTIHFHGVSPAVKDYNAMIVHSLNKLEVEALPNDLPERFEVDLAGLAKVGDAVHVRDIPAPAGVTILNDPEMMIAIATATHDEPTPAEGEGEGPEVIEKGKKEEE